MAIYIHCPQCNQRLDEMRPDCQHCGTALPPGVLYALASALGQQPPSPSPMPPGRMPPHVTQPARSAPTAPPPAYNSALRPWLAAALSVVCGLGQLYNGQIVKGLILIALGTAAVVSLPLIIGQIMIPLVWGYAIIDAYVVARRSVPSGTS
jgi:TM2 domain-containing membrane protein YozV